MLISKVREEVIHRGRRSEVERRGGGVREFTVRKKSDVS